ncbi:AMP-binding protein [Mesorhizobium sp. NBSH29]|uniref:AMP-dependent synthetase/ligase n=1 Tax=Mesorhizobium sp. NBSH29 TaxID=2654249 RepID=UPI0018967BE2|nr:AMP-binding protein [Mesorhizobium sp. NBSH29]
MAQGGETRELDTFAKLLCEHARVRPRRPAMRHKDHGIWRTWNWSELAETIRAYAAGLQQLGLERGATIAVIGENRPAMYWTILAAQWLGAIPVPVYADAVADEMAYTLDHADVAFAVVQDQEQVDKLISVQDRVPKLRTVIYDEPRGLRDYDHSHLHAVDNVIDSGHGLLQRDTVAAKAIDSERDRGQASDISIILYTSGTTGRSKGVLLSAGGSIAAARDTVIFDKLTDRDEVLAYLPLAWVGDHYLNYAQSLVSGFCIACPESHETAESDTQEIGPSFYFAPPRVFETLLTRITIRMEDAGVLKRSMFNYFIGVARRWGEKILDGKDVPMSVRLGYAIGNLLVYAPLKNVLGFSRIRVAYTAGEAIGPDLFSFYRSLGLNLKQLYGQTEAFLYVTAQPDGQIRAGTVGPATPNVDIRINDDGEVLYRSPGQFVGYYKDAEKTAETVTEDGYVKTGDAGFFDPDGHLNIIDRAQDVGKLSSGALFAPKYIENKLKFFPNIKEAVAFGQDRDFVTVMLNIDLTAVGNWAERKNIAYGSYQELAQRPEVHAMFTEHVAEVNKALAAEPRMATAQIGRFLILHKELDADDGEMTRTQKVRRSFIAERYKPLVDALYNGSDAADISTEVTFEDGRKGVISARVRIADAAVRQATRLGVAA